MAHCNVSMFWPFEAYIQYFTKPLNPILIFFKQKPKQYVHIFWMDFVDLVTNAVMNIQEVRVKYYYSIIIAFLLLLSLILLLSMMDLIIMLLFKD